MALPTYPVISNIGLVQVRYEEMRDAGESHNIAEMLALQSTPQIRTDSTFLAGECNGSQFEDQPEIGDFYKREAAAAGVDVKGKKYLSSLAEYPGDPKAWVSGRGDVQRVCEERGWGCRGSVNVKAADPDREPEEVGLAPDIVDSKVADIMGHVPERERPLVDIPALKHEVKEHYTPPWAK